MYAVQFSEDATPAEIAEFIRTEFKNNLITSYCHATSNKAADQRDAEIRRSMIELTCSQVADLISTSNLHVKPFIDKVLTNMAKVTSVDEFLKMAREHEAKG